MPTNTAETRMSDVHNATDRLRYSVNALELIARDMDRVGMSFLAERVLGATEHMLEDIKTLADAYSNEVWEGYRQAQQASFNVLEATLAGITISERAGKE